MLIRIDATLEHAFRSHTRVRMRKERKGCLRCLRTMGDSFYYAVHFVFFFFYDGRDIIWQRLCLREGDEEMRPKDILLFAPEETAYHNGTHEGDMRLQTGHTCMHAREGNGEEKERQEKRTSEMEENEMAVDEREKRKCTTVLYQRSGDPFCPVDRENVRARCQRNVFVCALLLISLLFSSPLSVCFPCALCVYICDCVSCVDVEIHSHNVRCRISLILSFVSAVAEKENDVKDDCVAGEKLWIRRKRD